MFVRPALACLGLLLVIQGCSGPTGPRDKPDLATVKGKLVQNGKPLPDAYVEFMPDSGAPSTARSDAEGSFELTYTDGSKGAKIGPHKVKVTVGGIVPGNEGGGGDPTPKPAKPAVPPTLYVLPDPVTIAPSPNELELTVPLKGQPG